MISPPILLRILDKAARAPSGDNCQPWNFQWKNSKLTVTHDSERAKHALDRGNNASLLSFGTLLESIELAALGEGFEARLSGAFPAYTYEFLKTSIPVDPLHAWLAQRATDRRAYQGGELSSQLLASLLDCASRFALVRLAWQPSPSVALVEHFEKMEATIWTTQAARDDVYRWIRFSGSHDDGMPWQSLGVAWHEMLALRAMQPWAVQSASNALGFISQLRAKLRSNIRSSAGLLCWSVTETSAEAVVQTGRWALRAWLTLNAAGFGAQPLSAGSLPLYDRASGAIRAADDPFGNLVTTGMPIVQDGFKLSPLETPLWILRTGVSSPIPTKSRTPRRRIKIET